MLDDVSNARSVPMGAAEGEGARSGDADLNGGAWSWRLIDGLHHRVDVHAGSDLLTPAWRGRAPRRPLYVPARTVVGSERPLRRATVRSFEQPASDKITCALHCLDLLSHWIFHQSTRTVMQCGGICTCEQQMQLLMPCLIDFSDGSRVPSRVRHSVEVCSAGTATASLLTARSCLDPSQMVLRALSLARNSHRLCRVKSPQPAARVAASAHAQRNCFTTPERSCDGHRQPAMRAHRAQGGLCQPTAARQMGPARR